MKFRTISLFALALFWIVSPLARADKVDYDVKTATQKLSERKAAIDEALKYAWSVAGRERFGLPPLSWQESAKLNAACDLLGQYKAEEAIRMGFFTLNQRTNGLRAYLSRPSLECAREGEERSLQSHFTFSPSRAHSKLGLLR